MEKEVIVLFLSYLIVSLSYVQTLPFGSLKMMGVLVTVYFPLSQIVVSHWNIPRRDFILFSVLAASALFQDTTLSQKTFSFFFYITLICWAFRGYEIIKTTKHILFAGMGIVLGILVGLIYSKSELIIQLSGLYNPRMRLWGAFTHPNHLGAMAAAAIIALSCSLLLAEQKSRKSITILLAALMTLVLLETKSRTALIMIIVFFVIYGMRSLGKLTPGLKLVAWILIAILGIWIIYSFFTSYAQEDGAYAGRLKIFHTMIVTPKTFFVGNGMVDSASLNRANTGGGAMEIGWVMLFYKNGIIGILAYIYIIFRIVTRIRKIPFSKQKWLAWAVLGSMMVGTLGEAYIVNITNISPMLEWTLLGALTFKEEGFGND